MKVLFYDPATPKSYTELMLSGASLGGTEATVLRVARGLQGRHEVYLAQHCRALSEETVIGGVHYLSFDSAHALKPAVVILLRQVEWVDSVAERFPQARRFLWLHNLPSARLYQHRHSLAANQFEVIAVSEFHRAHIRRKLAGNWYQRLCEGRRDASSIPVHLIYNPIPDELRPDPTAWNPHQLIFMSAPYKGLEQTLAIFERVRKARPQYELLLTDPGHRPHQLKLPAQVRSLGSLLRPQALRHLRESFCVFYPQRRRQETFGLVYAEANAVGTPVLAHDFGAASEILSSPSQLINSKQFSQVLNKLEEWQTQRPVLQAKESFRLSKVIQSWLELFES